MADMSKSVATIYDPYSIIIGPLSDSAKIVNALSIVGKENECTSHFEDVVDTNYCF